MPIRGPWLEMKKERFEERQKGDEDDVGGVWVVGNVWLIIREDRCHGCNSIREDRSDGCRTISGGGRDGLRKHHEQVLWESRQ